MGENCLDAGQPLEIGSGVCITPPLGSAQVWLSSCQTGQRMLQWKEKRLERPGEGRVARSGWSWEKKNVCIILRGGGRGDGVA